MQQIRTPLDKIAGVEVERLFDALFSHWHLALRSTRDVHGLWCWTAIDIGHARPRSELWLLIAMFIVRHFRLEAS
jgi:hypothetical protein